MRDKLLYTHQRRAQECQRGSARRPSGYLLSAYWTTYRMERASRTVMLSLRKKPPYAANLHFEGSKCCNDTSGKSARHSPRASDPSFSSELEFSKSTSDAMEQRARDQARMHHVRSDDRLPRLSNDILDRPGTRTVFPMHPCRCRLQAMETPIAAEET